MTAKKQTMSFEESLVRLEEIVRHLERGDLPLNESLSMYEEGTALIASCSKMLDEAEQKGVSEDAAEADSAMTFYSVLLQERTDSLFECQRMNVYWETKEDHRTVFKTSAEHQLMLKAGAYDVSARLMEPNLHVDDGWSVRKNPGLRSRFNKYIYFV